MPRIPRTQQTVSAQGRPLPYSTGDGYAAPGRAMQQLGKSIASAGKSVAGALGGIGDAAAQDAEQHALFNAKLDLTNFQGDQAQFQSEFDSSITGDGTGHVEAREQSFDTSFDTSLRQKYASAPEPVRQFVELSGAKLRNNFVNRSQRTAVGQRQTFYQDSTQQMLQTQVLPQLDGDVGSLEQSLDATERIIQSVPSTDQKMIAGLREKAASEIYKTWKAKAGPDAYEVGKGIAAEYTGRLKKAAPLGEIFKDRTPSAAERRAIFQKGGVVVNLDTNWAKAGKQTSPMGGDPGQCDGRTAVGGRSLRARHCRHLRQEVRHLSQSPRGHTLTKRTGTVGDDPHRALFCQ